MKFFALTSHLIDRIRCYGIRTEVQDGGCSKKFNSIAPVKLDDGCILTVMVSTQCC